MKALVLSLVLVSSSVFALGEKDPTRYDISVNSLIDHHCAKSGYFNPAACVSDVTKCYNKYAWPKTVEPELKIEVTSECVQKVIR
jgi:hypothetical protein